MSSTPKQQGFMFRDISPKNTSVITHTEVRLKHQHKLCTFCEPGASWVTSFIAKSSPARGCFHMLLRLEETDLQIVRYPKQDTCQLQLQWSS